MYVCLCKGITDSQIRDAVAGGLTNYRELRQSLGLSSQCGRCAVEARQIFRCFIRQFPPSLNAITNRSHFSFCYHSLTAVAGARTIRALICQRLEVHYAR
jgi:bacterioferritin-associated ferredoxin